MMIAVPLLPVQQAWLISLLALWFALLVGGFIFGKPAVEDDRSMPVWTRIGSSALLVLASLSWLYVASGTPAGLFAALIALGILLCFAGDLLLAGLLPVPKPLAPSMIGFGLGHACYILAFSSFIARITSEIPRWCAGVWIGWLLVGVGVWWQVVLRGQYHKRLRWPALAYTLLLATTAAVTTCLALQDRTFAPAAVGAMLFLASDSILAGNIFDNWQFRSLHDVVWLTYGPAQMLIVYSVGAAVNAVS
jgi:uncharacterized membrane protein YhhN